MKHVIVAAAGVALALFAVQTAEACTPIPGGAANLLMFPSLDPPVGGYTAVLVNPAGTVSGPVNATGCTIGIYYGPGTTGKVVDANIYGAEAAGIVNDGATVDIGSSYISDIGEQAPNSQLNFDGVAYGIGIYFCGSGMTLSPETGERCSSTSVAMGIIRNNRVWTFQKNGIEVHGPNASTQIDGNWVLGLGPNNINTQNGIEIGYGASVSVTNNTVIGNSWTGPASYGTGILLFGGPCFSGPLQQNTTVSGNTLIGNDIGIAFLALAANCATTMTVTGNIASNNRIYHNAVTNVDGGEGSDPPYRHVSCPVAGHCPYQAGIADMGDGDTITGNLICGLGYTPTQSSPPYLYEIDLNGSRAATVSNNKYSDPACEDGKGLQ
jgi:hypothetical protein